MYVRPIALNFFFSLCQRGRGARENESTGRRVSVAHILFSHSLLFCTRYTTKHGAALSLLPSVFRLAAASHVLVSLHAILSHVNMITKEISLFTTRIFNPPFLSHFAKLLSLSGMSPMMDKPTKETEGKDKLGKQRQK